MCSLCSTISSPNTHVCRPRHAHTHTVYTHHQRRQTNTWTLAKQRPSPCLLRHSLCLSLLIKPFHLVCIDYRLTSHSDTLRSPIHVCSPRDTHWVHCGEECLLSWPELACESMSIILSLWVLHNMAATIQTDHTTRPHFALIRGKVTGMVERADS